MTPLEAVDPELRPFYEAAITSQLSDEVLGEARANMDALIVQLLGAPVHAPAVETVANNDGHPIELRIHQPETRTAKGAVLHMHGGGMVLGSAKGFDPLAAMLAQSLGATVVSVEYRLAPETPFPGPVEDCYAGLSWLAEHAARLGADPARIVMAGESAGGGLAAALALLARDRGEVTPVGQVLTYPMLDHRTGTPEDPYQNDSAGLVSWSRHNNRYGWGALQGSRDIPEGRLAYFSPARADDLSGLPPAWIGTGGLDLFVDENINYARRLNAAGVPVEFHLYPGAPHAFDSFPQAAVARQITHDRMEAFARFLG